MTPTTPKPRPTRSKPASPERHATSAPNEAAEQQAQQVTPSDLTSATSPEVHPHAVTTLSATEAAPPAPAEQTAPPAPAARVTKVGQLQALLAAPAGATLAGLCEALGWQSHTVRAALTRLRQAGHAVERSRTEDGRTVYRIAPIGTSEANDPVDPPTEADMTVELTFSGERATSVFAALLHGEGA